MALTAASAQRALAGLADPAVAKVMMGFFRTGKGEYGEGDRFRGIKVPKIRLLARQYRAMPLGEISRLLTSPFHEDRMLALVVLCHRAQRSEPDEGLALARFYLRNRAGINNWDLVDISAPIVVGPYRDALTKEIERLSRSKRLWDRRLSVLVHMHEIRSGRTDRFYAFATRFLGDREDLMHKAVGWLLREAGQRDLDGLMAFLEAHRERMPRTMLRYAIEKLPADERRRLMA